MGVANLDAVLGESLTVEDYHISDPAVRPSLAHNAYDAESDSIPCIDVAAFRSLPVSSPARKETLDKFLKGVSAWGFFQVINHGVDDQLLTEIVALAENVFKMPLPAKRERVSPRPGAAGYFCGSMDRRKVWQESLQTPADPQAFEALAEKLWGSGEAGKFTEVFNKYALAIKKLGVEMFELLEEALGIKRMGISELWDAENTDATYIRMINYPPCEEPEAVLGAPAHTDPNLITLLHEDDIGGLQILKEGKWICCRPKRGAFIINAGDCFQVASNDIIPSIQHRVCVNKERARMSFAAFFSPKQDVIIQPSPDLVDGEHPARFKGFKYIELLTASKELIYNGRKHLTRWRIE